MSTWPQTVGGWLAFFIALILMAEPVFWMRRARREWEDAERKFDEIDHGWDNARKEIEHAERLLECRIEHERELAEFDRLLAHPPQREHHERHERHVVTRPEPLPGAWTTTLTGQRIFEVGWPRDDDRPPRQRQASAPSERYDRDQ